MLKINTFMICVGECVGLNVSSDEANEPFFVRLQFRRTANTFMIKLKYLFEWLPIMGM